MVVLGLAALVLTVTVLLWPETSRGTAWRTAELLIVVALGAAGLAAARGSTVAATPDGNDPLLTALPMLVCVAGGLLAARLWVPLAAALAHRLPTRAVASRLAVVGAVRRPLVVVTTVGFVTAAIAAVVFSGAYRATLLEGAADQAGFQVPLDARLMPGGDSASPLQVVAGRPRSGRRTRSCGPRPGSGRPRPRLPPPRCSASRRPCCPRSRAGPGSRVTPTPVLPPRR